MINRVLIRIKVVQMLYSYLLTRSEFKIESAPDTVSRERKYAYSVYIDLLLLILELSGYSVDANNTTSPLDNIKARNPLNGSKLAAALASDNTIRDIILRGTSGIKAYDPILLRLHQTIVGSAAFTDYKKKRRVELSDDVKFWTVVLQTIIAKNTLVQEIARKNELFSGKAFDNGVKMVVDTLTNYNDTRTMLANAKTSLQQSLNKAYELYHALLLLPVAITNEEEQRLEANKNKYLPTPEDLNPNTRFIDNAYVKAISENADMEEYLKQYPISFEGDYFLIKSLLDQIHDSDIYRDYMESPTTDSANDCEFWRKVMKNIVIPSDALAEALENKSVYWNDDVDIMGTFALKTMKVMAGLRNPAEVRLLPQYKDDIDANFGSELFVNAIDNRDTYRSYIDRFINRDQWESERLAFMDIVVLIAAITEMLHFPSIPLAVTINEYVEIAKCYSTPKAGQFVNGMLYSIVTYLQEEGILLKRE